MPLRIEGHYRLPVAPARAWALLLDQEALRACIPGCESLTATGPDAYDAVLKLGVGPIRGTFRGSVRLTDLKPPESLRLALEASGTPGIVRGTADLRLAAAGDETEVTVAGEAEVGGSLVAVGQGLLGSVARGQLDRFFAALRARAAAEARAASAEER